MSFKVYIPARFSASRLPGKPLLDIGGEPLLQRVYNVATASASTETVIVTDDARIHDRARAFGAVVVMTGEHASGTDRIAAAVRQREEPDDAIIVNLQGDEPLMPPALLNQVAGLLEADRVAEMATLYAPIASAEELFDPNVVKIVCSSTQRALYFSRAPIPWDRGTFGTPGSVRTLGSNTTWCRHLGIYAYRVGFLKRFAGLERSPLEQTEMLEQLRALWHGVQIAAAPACTTAGPGVDTEADLDLVRQAFGAVGRVGPAAASCTANPTELVLPPEPEKPAPYECCGRGCENCVFVYYEKALAKWRAELAALGAAAATPQA